MAPLQVLRELDSSLRGLDEGEAQARLARYGDNTLRAERSRGPLNHRNTGRSRRRRRCGR
jgi:Cation transporter/ATPase, N-terminus